MSNCDYIMTVRHSSQSYLVKFKTIFSFRLILWSCQHTYVLFLSDVLPLLYSSSDVDCDSLHFYSLYMLNSYDHSGGMFLTGVYSVIFGTHFWYTVHPGCFTVVSSRWLINHVLLEQVHKCAFWLFEMVCLILLFSFIKWNEPTRIIIDNYLTQQV